MDYRLLEKTINALRWLIYEVETNYLFGEDEEELKALENAEKTLDELCRFRDSL